MALPPINREEFLKRLDGIAAPKNTANPKLVSNGVKGMFDRKSTAQPQGLGGTIFSTVLKPLVVLDTPRRAIISGIRETVDALDGDSNTTASFNDFKNQALNPVYGFGTAFPMKGFMGRAIGFVGDVVFDPLTYATLGGTVAKKAVTSTGMATRAALGGTKNVTGRQGRTALAKLSKERLNDMAANGMKFQPNEINTLVRDIAARGKSAMPGFLRDDIGIKGPGVYYFGSRLKVASSGIIGDFVERKLVTPARLGFVNPKYKLNPGQYLHKISTPDGTFQMSYVDPETVRKYRVGLANGTLNAKEANMAISLLDMTDKQRVMTAKALEKGTQKAFDSAADPAMGSYKTSIHNIMETGTQLVAGDRRIPVIAKLQTFFRELFEDIDIDFKQLDDSYNSTPMPNYVPHMESDTTILNRAKSGESAFNSSIGGVPIDDTQRTASSFRGRKYKAGDIFFGHKLTPENSTIDQMNLMARNPLEGAINPATELPYKAINYDFYETDMTKIIAKYVRHYSQQKGYAAFMRAGLENGEDFMRSIARDVPLAAEFATKRAATAPVELTQVGSMVDDIVRPLNSAVNTQASVFAGGTKPYLSGDSLLLPTPATAVPTPATVAPTPAVATAKPITTFRNTFLSNFAPAQIEYEGIVYPSNEHFYQAMKTEDIAKRQQIAKAPNAAAAKRMGNVSRPNWDSIKDKVMMFGLKQKFAPGSPLAKKLIETGDAVLMEGNTWGDTYWGMFAGKGENRLGKMLMEIRDELNLSTTVAPAPATVVPTPATVAPTPAPVTLLNETRTKMNELGKVIENFKQKFETVPLVYEDIMGRYVELSDRLNAQILRDETDINFIEKFADDLSLFQRDFLASMKTNNYVFKPQSSEVLYPKWYSKDTPNQQAIHSATKGNVETNTTNNLFNILLKLRNKYKIELDSPQTVKGPMLTSERYETQEILNRQFRKRRVLESGLNRRYRAALEQYQRATEIAVFKTRNTRPGSGADSIIRNKEDLVLDEFQSVRSIVGAKQKVIRVISAGFQLENLVHYSASLDELRKVIAETKKMGYGYVASEKYINEVLETNASPYLANAYWNSQRVANLKNKLAQLRLTENSSIDNIVSEIDKLYDEPNVVINFLKNNYAPDAPDTGIIRTLKDADSKKITAKDIKTYFDYHLGVEPFDDGILEMQSKLYRDRAEYLQSNVFARDLNEELFPIHKRKTVDELNNEVNTHPAIVKHTKQVNYGPNLKTYEQRKKELEGLPSVLKQEFTDYVKRQALKAKEFRKRIREQVVPKHRAAQLDLDEFSAKHEKDTKDFFEKVISQSRKSKDYKSFSVQNYLREAIKEHFPNAAGFFDSFVLANKSIFDFLEDIAINSKQGIMSDNDYVIGLTILKKKYSNKSGIYRKEIFDNIFDLFTENIFLTPSSSAGISVTYENFIDIITHTLGVKIFNDIDNAVMPTMLDLQARVAAQENYILRLTQKAISAEQEVLTATPNNVLKQNRNRLIPILGDDIVEPSVRQVNPATGEIRDFPVAQLKQTELENSDYYPFAKSVEKRANTLLALRGINGNDVDWTLGGQTQLMYNQQPLTISMVRWTQLMEPEKLDMLPGDEIDYILSWLKQDDVKQIILKDDFLEKGSDISDEELLQAFSVYLYQKQPQTIAPDFMTLKNRRYEAVQGLWNNSDANKFLSEINRLKKLSADDLAAKQALDPVRAIDSIMTESNTIAMHRTTESVRAEEWVNNYGVESMPEVVELVRLQKELVKKVNDEFEPFTVDNRPTKYSKNPKTETASKRDALRDSGAALPSKAKDARSQNLVRESLIKDNRYLSLLKMGIPREILDGPLDELNNWMLANAKESVGLLAKLKIQKNYVDNILKASDDELAQRSTLQLNQELTIIRTLKEQNIVTPYTENNLAKLRRVREKILDTREPGYGPYPIVREPTDATSRAQVERMVNPPADVEYMGATRPGEMGDIFYDDYSGSALQQASVGNPASTRFYDDAAAEGGELVSEQLPTSTPAAQRRLPVYEIAYQYNPNLSYGEQVTPVGPRKASLENDIFQLPTYENIEDVLINALNLPRTQKNVKENVQEIAIAKFTSDYDAVSASLAKARMALASKTNKVASDVNTVDTVALEQIDNAQKVLQQVGGSNNATPAEQVIIDIGVKQAEILNSVADKTTEQIEEAMMDGISGKMSGVRLLLPSGEIVEMPFPDAASLIRQNLTDGWKRLGGKFQNIEVTPEFKELWDNAKYFEDPRFIRELTNYLGGFTKFHKAYATLTPGFHIRNVMGNTFQYVLAGGKIENLKPATKIHFDWLAAYKKGSTWKDFLRTLDPADAEAATIARNAMLGSGGGIYGDVFHEVVRGNKIYDNRLTRFSRKYGQMSDNMSRFVLGFDAAKQGMNSEMATARVRKFYFDYEDLSKLDRTMKQFIPFWIWSSRNLPLQLENMWLNPKPYLIYNSFVRNIRDKDSEKRSPLPKFLQEVEGFKVPGLNAYAAPDLNFTRVQQQLSQIANPKKFGTNLNPLFRVPAEQAIGQNLFNDEEFESPEDRLVSLLQGLVVPVATGDRLLNSYGDAKVNAWLGFFGSPVRKIKEK